MQGARCVLVSPFPRHERRIAPNRTPGSGDNSVFLTSTLRMLAGGPGVDKAWSLNPPTLHFRPMTPVERLEADMSGTGLTIGWHAMTYVRSELEELGIVTAVAVAESPNGALVTVAGLVIVRQRPGSAKGFLFMSLEDETGISNIIIKRDTFDQYKLPLLENNFLIIDGINSAAIRSRFS
jgi:DNA polymerase III alpha subunit